METLSENPHKNNVHKILAHSYTVYFVLLLVGVGLDIIFKVKIFADSVMVPVGLFFLILSTALIIWAQKSGNELTKVAEKRAEHFYRGPYRYTRIPTHCGLLLLILGFGIVTNSFFVILSMIVAFLISKFLFVDKYHKILEEKYGTAYQEYKKLVKF